MAMQLTPKMYLFRKKTKEKAVSRRNGLLRLVRALEQIKAQKDFLERDTQLNT